MHGLARRFRRDEHRRRRHRSRSGGAALHQRAHRGRCGQVRAAIAGSPFATPVVAANVRPDAFDRRSSQTADDDRSGALARPQRTSFSGLGVAFGSTGKRHTFARRSPGRGIEQSTTASGYRANQPEPFLAGRTGPRAVQRPARAPEKQLAMSEGCCSPTRRISMPNRRELAGPVFRLQRRSSMKKGR